MTLVGDRGVPSRHDTTAGAGGHENITPQEPNTTESSNHQWHSFDKAAEDTQLPPPPSVVSRGDRKLFHSRNDIATPRFLDSVFNELDFNSPMAASINRVPPSNDRATFDIRNDPKSPRLVFPIKRRSIKEKRGRNDSPFPKILSGGSRPPKDPEVIEILNGVKNEDGPDHAVEDPFVAFNQAEIKFLSKVPFKDMDSTKLWGVANPIIVSLSTMPSPSPPALPPSAPPKDTKATN